MNKKGPVEALRLWNGRGGDFPYCIRYIFDLDLFLIIINTRKAVKPLRQKAQKH